jgi:hypothetical protein
MAKIMETSVQDPRTSRLSCDKEEFDVGVGICCGSLA